MTTDWLVKFNLYSMYFVSRWNICTCRSHLPSFLGKKSSKFHFISNAITPNRFEKIKRYKDFIGNSHWWSRYGNVLRYHLFQVKLLKISRILVSNKQNSIYGSGNLSQRRVTNEDVRDDDWTREQNGLSHIFHLYSRNDSSLEVSEALSQRLELYSNMVYNYQTTSMRAIPNTVSQNKDAFFVSVCILCSRNWINSIFIY